jgi:hypothetical protein
LKDCRGTAGVSQQNPRIVTGFISGSQLALQAKAIVRVVSADDWLSFQLVVENLLTNQWLSLHKFPERVKRPQTCLLILSLLNLFYLKPAGK